MNLKDTDGAQIISKVCIFQVDAVAKTFVYFLIFFLISFNATRLLALRNHIIKSSIFKVNFECFIVLQARMWH